MNKVFERPFGREALGEMKDKGTYYMMGYQDKQEEVKHVIKITKLFWGLLGFVVGMLTFALLSTVVW